MEFRFGTRQEYEEQLRLLISLLEKKGAEEVEGEYEKLLDEYLKFLGGSDA